MTLTEQAIATIAAGCEGDEDWMIGPANSGQLLALCALAQEALQSRREGQQMREALTELHGAIMNGLCNSGTPGFDGPERLERALTAAERALSHPKPESVKNDLLRTSSRPVAVAACLRHVRGPAPLGSGIGAGSA